MGTRHIICIFWQGKWYLAQFGPWDGYPSGQGAKIFNFLSIPTNIENLKAGLQYCTYILTEEDNKTFPSNRTRKEETLQPAICAKILDVIANAGAQVLEVMKDDPHYDANESDKLLLNLELEFVLDTVFCEWTYVIDLDLSVLEVYAGRQQKTETHRFRDLGRPESSVPVLIAAFDFVTLRTITEELFLTACRDSDSEEE